MPSPNLVRELKTGTQNEQHKSDETDLNEKGAATGAETTGIDEILDTTIGAMTEEADTMTGEEDETIGDPGEAQVPTEGATEVQVHIEGDKKKRVGNGLK